MNPATPAPAFRLSPLLGAYLCCTMAMMAFVSLIGPISRQLGLQAWQAGTVVSVAGVLWMLLSRPWGTLSDRRGRRPVLLSGLVGFTLAYVALCAFLIACLRWGTSPLWVFLGLLLTRGLAGAFFAAVPTTGQALVADHFPVGQRTGAMASLGAANAVGVVLGPALAALLARQGLWLPLLASTVLPVVALTLVWRLPRSGPIRSDETAATLLLSDRRLRRPMVVAFLAMSAVSVAQITVGFFAIDRLQLSPEAAARTAGLALTMVGVALVLAQLVVRRLGWPPAPLIRAGLLVASAGFGLVAVSHDQVTLMAGFFVAGAGMGWVFPAFAALAANAVGPSEQGAAAGSVGAAQGLGIVLGPLAGSLFYEIAPGVPYVVAAVALVLTALWPMPATTAQAA